MPTNSELSKNDSARQPDEHSIPQASDLGTGQAARAASAAKKSNLTRKQRADAARAASRRALGLK